MNPLFGSETRARVLEQLATTPRAQSAYRIARAIGAEPIQVLKILKQLEGLTEHSAAGWVLKNQLLRRFVRDRMARVEAQNRQEKNEHLVHFGMKPSSGHAPAQPQPDHRNGPGTRGPNHPVRLPSREAKGARQRAS
jgi:hypothetical protein